TQFGIPTGHSELHLVGVAENVELSSGADEVGLVGSDLQRCRGYRNSDPNSARLKTHIPDIGKRETRIAAEPDQRAVGGPQFAAGVWPGSDLRAVRDRSSGKCG